MRHFSCDICSKNLTGSETRYVVRMETFAIEERPQLTDADLEQDHIEAMAEMLAELEEAGDITETVPTQSKREFDLCPACHRKFSADPLGREPARKLHFSKN